MGKSPLAASLAINEPTSIAGSISRRYRTTLKWPFVTAFSRPKLLVDASWSLVVEMASVLDRDPCLHASRNQFLSGGSVRVSGSCTSDIATSGTARRDYE